MKELNLGETMKKFVILLIICLFASNLLGAKNSKSDPKKSGAHFEIVGGNTFNWGKVTPQDGRLAGQVYMTNTGTETMTITKVKPGCSCTSDSLEKDVLAPGDTTKLSFKLDFGRHLGKVQKIIQIETDAPNASHLVLFLKCDVQVPVTPYPDKYFRLNKMELNEPKSSTLRLKNTTELPITITNLIFEDDRRRPAEGLADVKVEVPNEENPDDAIIKYDQDIIGTVIEPGKHVNITLTATAIEYGRLAGNCVLKFDNTKQDHLRIYFWGKAEEEIEMPYDTGNKK